MFITWFVIILIHIHSVVLLLSLLWLLSLLSLYHNLYIYMYIFSIILISITTTTQKNHVSNPSSNQNHQQQHNTHLPHLPLPMFCGHLLRGDVATSQAADVVLGTEIRKLPRQGDQKGWLRHTRTPQRTFALSVGQVVGWARKVRWFWCPKFF